VKRLDTVVIFVDLRTKEGVLFLGMLIPSARESVGLLFLNAVLRRQHPRSWPDYMRLICYVLIEPLIFIHLKLRVLLLHILIGARLSDLLTHLIDILSKINMPLIFVP
jgi:hypothetical protein